ncbi:hypothetical protein AncyloWKF20_08570 [Ancylobacter sp. WKF20]|uniref:hypothetical protein n=1 Tax=Ancylobacter sp. WKF20 TaxID=3039801 RepID=UPI00243430B5|nr:hypothetical protein [Ancylobacter sp. WKF20]WGD31857.1 hypothetical protein AncyloWKF20_08570 [Ancylobacter sp. WKF20]
MADTGAKFPIIRLRAGILVLIALIMVSSAAGRWMATLFSLGWGWAALIGIAVALLIALIVTRLDRLAYFGIAALVTLFAAYTAYDFARGPIDWSEGAAFLLALVPAVLLGAAFWDFRHFVSEVRAWANSRS